MSWPLFATDSPPRLLTFISLFCSQWDLSAMRDLATSTTFVSFGVLLQVAYWHPTCWAHLVYQLTTEATLLCVTHRNLANRWGGAVTSYWTRTDSVTDGKNALMLGRRIHSCNKWAKVSYRTCLLRDNWLIYFVTLSSKTLLWFLSPAKKKLEWHLHEFVLITFNKTSSYLQVNYSFDGVFILPALNLHQFRCGFF